MDDFHYEHPKTIVNVFHYRFTWRVENVYMCKKLLETVIDGPNFGGKHVSFPWMLQLGQLPNPEAKGISLFIRRTNTPVNGSAVNCRVCVYKNTNSIPLLDKKFQTTFSCGSTWESPIIVTNDDFKREVTVGDIRQSWKIHVQLMWNESIDFESVAETNTRPYKLFVYARAVALNLKEFFKEQWLSDIYLQNGGKRIPAHRAILASMCLCLDAILKWYTYENREIDDSFILFSRDPDVFDTFLMYLYSGDIYSITENGPLPIGIDVLAKRTEMLFLHSISRPILFTGKTSVALHTATFEWALEQSHLTMDIDVQFCINSKYFGPEDTFSLSVHFDRSQENPENISVTLKLDHLNPEENIYAVIDLVVKCRSEVLASEKRVVDNLPVSNFATFINFLNLDQLPQEDLNVNVVFECKIQYSGRFETHIEEIPMELHIERDKPLPDFDFIKACSGWNLIKNSMRKLLFNKDYSDCTIVVEGERIPCHRVVLAARSPYFSAVFKKKEEEEEGSSLGMDIFVEDDISVNSDVMRVILEALYTGSVEMSDEELIRDIRLPGKFFGLETLERRPKTLNITWDSTTMTATIVDDSNDGKPIPGDDDDGNNDSHN